MQSFVVVESLVLELVGKGGGSFWPLLGTDISENTLKMEYLTLLKRMHFESSFRLTEKILKVPASWGQQISTSENRLSQKNSHLSFKALHF